MCVTLVRCQIHLLDAIAAYQNPSYILSRAQKETLELCLNNLIDDNYNYIHEGSKHTSDTRSRDRVTTEENQCKGA
jgi:hypothetical protein